MGRKNEIRGRKRKSPGHNPKLQTSPPAKRRMAINGIRRKPAEESTDIQQWLRQPTVPETTIEHTAAPPSENNIIIQAEIHHAPSEPICDSDSSDLDAIDIALDIAKDAASVKYDIKRIEQIIIHTKDAQIREHNILLELLNSIQDNVQKMYMKSDTLEEKINNLSNKINVQEQGLNDAKHDIETLFKSISKLEKQQSSHAIIEQTAPSSVSVMDVDEGVNSGNSIVISNLPNHDKDEEDVMTLLYVGLSLPIHDIAIKNISRSESKGEEPGNLTMELETIDHKIHVLRKKRDLRYTNEYHNVFIRSVKSRSDIIMERNFTAILNNIPRNHNLMMASNGKIITRNQTTSTGNMNR